MSDLSRVEQLLRNALGEDIYNVSPMSRIEELLVQLNELIEGLDASVDPEAIAGIVTGWLAENIHDGAVVDSSLSVAGAAAESKKVGDEISDLKEDLTALVEEEHSNLLYGKTRINKWFVDPTTGIGRTLNIFFSYENIAIPSGTLLLFPYNDRASDKTVRSIAFYESDGTFISGVGHSDYAVTNGVNVPTNATKFSATFVYVNSSTQEVAYHYISTQKVDTVDKSIKSGVAIQSSDVYGNVLADNRRMPCINFQFDDGVANDATIVDIFTAKGLTCGFALVANQSDARVYSKYLGYQNQGFEAMSHSTTSDGMNDASVDSDVIEQRLKQSKQLFENCGFKIHGFVTPNSTMNSKFKPLLRKYYDWATTTYYGDYTGSNPTQPYMSPVDGAYNIWRVSLQGTTLANAKIAVDKCIENYGCLTFYGHAAALDTTDNLTTANLNELLDYINVRVANGRVLCGNPSDMIRQYFQVRNDDISDGWIKFSETGVNLDSRLEKVAWQCFYNQKLKLAYLNIRLKATEAIAGQFYICDNLPFSSIEGFLINNNANRECIIYGGTKILLTGSNTWASGTSYRFTGLFKIN